MYNSTRLLLILVVFTVSIYAVPVPDSKDDEVELVTPVNGLRSFNPFGLGSDTGLLPPTDFYKSLNDAFESMRRQMAALLKTEFNKSSIDPNKGNTTSVTKVINGHEYVLNETIYSDGDDHTRSLVKVRVVEIKPTDKDKNKEKSNDVSGDDSIETLLK